MTSGRGRNLAASVRARLQNLARERREPFEYVLNRYAVERWLHRLSISVRRDELVLKGATLLRVWDPSSHRPTRDVDFLGFGSPEIDDIAAVVREICSVNTTPDGIVFPGETVRASRIKDDSEYEGVRVTMEARLDGAKIPVQIDVGFGDAVQPIEKEYPVLLEHGPGPRLRVYPLDVVVAEKVQAMVDLGLANSRMKDFYDVWYLATRFEFDGAALVAAVWTTFERRRTPIASTAPLALTPEFANHPDKQKQWSAFLKRTSLLALPLPELVETIARFILPVLGTNSDTRDLGSWPPGGPWPGSR